MKKPALIILINLIILVAYTVAVYATLKGPHAYLGVLIFLAIFIAIQVITDITLGIIFMAKKKKEIGKMFFISSGLVLLIGFSACLGGESLVP